MPPSCVARPCTEGCTTKCGSRPDPTDGGWSPGTNAATKATTAHSAPSLAAAAQRKLKADSIFHIPYLYSNKDVKSFEHRALSVGH